MGNYKIKNQRGVISILVILYAASLGLTIIGVPFFLVDSYLNARRLKEIRKNVRLLKKMEENTEKNKRDS